jgi:tetratricopeptide (TPR) repeat protein
MKTPPAIRGIWLPAIVALVVNLGALTPGFIHDDHRLIEQNELIRDLSRVPDIASEGYWSVDDQSIPNLYRPLTILSFALNHAVGGLQPFGYRAVNLLLHVLVTVMVVQLCRRACGGASPGAASAAPQVAGLLFAVHPVHTEVLGYVVGRAELLAAAGSLGCVLLFLIARAREGQSPRGTHVGLAVISLACFAAGFLAKENAVIAPVLVLAADRWIVGRRIAWRYHLAGAATLLVVLGLRFAVLGGLNPGGIIHEVDNPIAGAPFLQGRLTAVEIIGRYAWLLVAPLRLAIDYSFDTIPLVQGLLEPGVLVGLLLMGAWAVGLATSRRRAPVIAFSLSWMGLTLLPVANLLLPIGTILAERLLYLPSVGFCLLVAAAFQRLESAATASGGSRATTRVGTLRVVAAIVLMALAARSTVRLRDWRDDYSIFKAALAVHPRSVRSLFNYASACETRGEDREARRAYEKAIAIFPQFAPAHYNLAGLHARGESWSEAVRHYREALRQQPGNPRYLVNLGNSLNRTASYSEARVVLARALEADPQSSEAYTNLGAALLGLGETEAAVDAYRQSVRLDPENADYQTNLGLALQRAGRSEEAAAALKRSLALRPGDIDLQAAIGLALLDAGEIASSLQILREVVRRQPEHPIYHYRLGRALEADGRPAEAAEQYRDSIRLSPSSPIPLRSLGILLYRSGERAEARRVLERAEELDGAGSVMDEEARRILRELRNGPGR